MKKNERHLLYTQAKETGRVQKDVMDLQQRNPFTHNKYLRDRHMVQHYCTYLNVRGAMLALSRLCARTYGRQD